VYTQYKTMYDTTKAYYRLSGLLGGVEGGNFLQVTRCRKRLLHIKIGVDRAFAGASRSVTANFSDQLFFFFFLHFSFGFLKCLLVVRCV
jgi:hypothetical protein